MASNGSVTHWIHEFKQGNLAAAQPLWERYHGRLLGLARQALNGSARRHADEEDVVQNSFQGLFHGMLEGRFPRLDDRDDLWRLLVVITARKAIDQIRKESRETQARVTPGPASTISTLNDTEESIEQIVGDEPTPELAVELIEQYDNLLTRLQDPQLQRIAVQKLEGYTNGEIAAALGCSRRTVIRKLDVIRLIWSEEEEEV